MCAGGIPFSPPSPFEASLRAFQGLLSLGMAVFSRSSLDVFPFFLDGVVVFRQAEPLLDAVNHMLASEEVLANSQSHGFRDITEHLKEYRDLLSGVVHGSGTAALVLRLETISAVFGEARRILAQTDKCADEIRSDVAEFVESIKVLVALDNRFATIGERFQRFNRELYVAYDCKEVPRTNDDLEYFNNTIKRPIRKNMGKKISWFYLENLGESVAFHQNIIPCAHTVGGTSIKNEDLRSPLERLGVIECLSVSAIMGSVGSDVLKEIRSQIEKRYGPHRWVCKLSRKGVRGCIGEIMNEWYRLTSDLTCGV